MTHAEPVVQRIFSNIFSGLIVAVPIICWGGWLRAQYSRWPGPDRVTTGLAQEVALGSGLRAWRLTAPDRRFGGLSALAIEGNAMIALTDSGVTIRFSRPRGAKAALRVALHDLPGGPDSENFKWARDSESLLKDNAGRGWWVAFEGPHSLYLFDSDFRRVRWSRRLQVNWRDNRGGEALLEDRKGRAMVLPEGGGQAIGGRFVAPKWTSDATRLADGRVVLLVRQPTWRGFANRIEIAAGAGRPGRRYELALNPLDNMEGIAAEVRPDGGARLWIVSDDNFRPWMRTLLVAFDLPAGA